MKKFIALALSSVLLFSVAACGPNESSDKTESKTKQEEPKTTEEKTTTEAPKTTEAPPTEEPDDTDDTDGTKEPEDTDKPDTPDNPTVGVVEDFWELPAEPVQLIWLNGDPGTVPPDLERVENALDEITVDQMNIKVHTMFLNDEGVKLHISSGENWDMAYSCDWYNNYGEQVRNGYFEEIGERVKEVTPTLYSIIPEILWEGITIDGGIYGVPIVKDYAAENFWRLDADLMDDLGMEVPYALDDFGDIEPYLEATHQAIQDGNPLTEKYNYVFERAPLGTNSNFERISTPAAIGLPFQAQGTDEEHKIVFIYSSPYYMERLRYLRSWNEKGYMSPEIPTQEQLPQYSGVKADQGFYGADAIWSSQDGYRQYIARFNGPTVSTSTVTNVTVFNINSEHLDEALMFTQFVNTDQKYRDMLRYGIEGEHFSYNDEGLVLRNQEKAGDYMPWPFSQASYALSSVEDAEGVEVDPDMWLKIFEIYDKEAIASDALGFSFDPKPVESQIVAVNSVVTKYNTGLNSGFLDPETIVPQMEEEANAAGLQEVIDEAQRQLDEFLENKGITPRHS